MDPAACRAQEAEDRKFRLEGDLTPGDVAAIKRVIATVSQHPVITIQTRPERFLELAAKHGGDPIEVRTLASWSCYSSSGQILVVVRTAQTWRVVDEISRWEDISCD